MFKKIFILFFALINLYANTSIHGVVKQINGYEILVELFDNASENDLKNGAFVVKTVDKYSMIVARAKFLSKEDNFAKLELYTFSDLKQSALPIPAVLPQIGDDVIFNTRIKNTLLIAPSKEAYEYVTNNYNDFEFFDTNVFSAYLMQKKQALPTRNDFRDFCKTWVLGSVAVVLEDKLKLYECSSLDKIAEVNLDKAYTNEENINFYSNFKESLSKKTDYFSYYYKLFKEKE